MKLIADDKKYTILYDDHGEIWAVCFRPEYTEEQVKELFDALHLDEDFYKLEKLELFYTEETETWLDEGYGDEHHEPCWAFFPAVVVEQNKEYKDWRDEYFKKQK